MRASRSQALCEITRVWSPLSICRAPLPHPYRGRKQAWETVSAQGRLCLCLLICQMGLIEFLQNTVAVRIRRRLSTFRGT